MCWLNNLVICHKIGTNTLEIKNQQIKKKTQCDKCGDYDDDDDDDDDDHDDDEEEEEDDDDDDDNNNNNNTSCR